MCSSVLVGRTYQQPLILQRGAASWWIFHISAGRDLTLGPPITHCDASCDGPLDACKSETFWLQWERIRLIRRKIYYWFWKMDSWTYHYCNTFMYKGGRSIQMRVRLANIESGTIKICTQKYLIRLKGPYYALFQSIDFVYGSTRIGFHTWMFQKHFIFHNFTLLQHLSSQALSQMVHFMCICSLVDFVRRLRV